MRWALCWLAMVCCLTSAQAQNSPEGLTREQVQAARNTEEAKFLAQEQACYARFAVNDCLQQVRAQKRLVFDALRLQDIRLNDLERSAQGADQLKLIQEKSSPEKLEEAKVRRLEALDAQNEREANAAKKLAERLPAAAPLPDGQRASSPVGVSRSAEGAAKNKLAFEQKLKDAQEHRASRDKARQEKKADKPAKPLPVE